MDRQTDTHVHRMTTVTLAHALRVNNMGEIDRERERERERLREYFLSTE